MYAPVSGSASSSTAASSRGRTRSSKTDEAPPPPYAPPVAYAVAPPPAGTTYVVARGNRTYVLTPDVYVVDVDRVAPGVFSSARSVVCRCPSCRCIVETYTVRTGCGPFVWLWVLLFLIIFWPLFWVPLVFGFGSGDIEHYCPVCDSLIARVSD